MNEVKVTIIDRKSVSHELVAPTDMNMNVMELCKAYELPVLGECGGMAMCASCQCYIESEHTLPEMNDDEDAMLAEAFNTKDNSRLGCQIYITEKMQGLTLTLAPEE